MLTANWHFTNATFTGLGKRAFEGPFPMKSLCINAHIRISGFSRFHTQVLKSIFGLYIQNAWPLNARINQLDVDQSGTWVW